MPANLAQIIKKIYNASSITLPQADTMQKYFLIALIFLMPAARAVQAADADRWNLQDLYPTAAAWNLDSATLDAQLKQFSQCRGQLKASAKRFKTCLDLNADLQKRFARLSSYAAQTNDEDTGASAGLDLKQRADVQAVRVEEAASFLRPEVLALGRKTVAAMLSRDKSLAIYRHQLDEILRAAPHTLDTKGEALVAGFGLATGAANAVYSTLSNADMPWPKVTLSDGSEVVLDQAAYTKYRALGNRADRKLVFDQFWASYHAFESSLGAALSTTAPTGGPPTAAERVGSTPRPLLDLPRPLFN